MCCVCSHKVQSEPCVSQNDFSVPQYVKVFLMVHFARDLKIYCYVLCIPVRSYIVVPSYLCIIFLPFFIIRSLKIYFIGHFEVFIMFILSTIFTLILSFKKCFLPTPPFSPILCNCHSFPYWIHLGV